jgi:hypothetical protein
MRHSYFQILYVVLLYFYSKNENIKNCSCDVVLLKSIKICDEIALKYTELFWYVPYAYAAAASNRRCDPWLSTIKSVVSSRCKNQEQDGESQSPKSVLLARVLGVLIWFRLRPNTNINNNFNITF